MQVKESQDLYHFVRSWTCTWNQIRTLFEWRPYPNIFVACFTTFWARLRLSEAVELLHGRFLYFCWDGVIYVNRTYRLDPVSGDHLCDFADELGHGNLIVKFCSGGSKKCGYRWNEGKTVCKVKGFSLNLEGAEQLNYEVMH